MQVDDDYEYDICICLYTILTIRNDIHEFYNASALQREIREIRKMQDGLWDSKNCTNCTRYARSRIEGNIFINHTISATEGSRFIAFSFIVRFCGRSYYCTVVQKLYLGPIHHSKLHLKRP